MRKMIMALSAIVIVAAPTLASAYTSGCERRAEHRKVVGTVLGGLAGAVIGNQVSHNGGALVGGLGGAVVGNQLSRTSCDHYYSRSRYRHGYAPAAYRYGGRPNCVWRDRTFTDAHGQLMHQQVQVCR
jgi:uncharacterized membrane protein